MLKFKRMALWAATAAAICVGGAACKPAENTVAAVGKGLAEQLARADAFDGKVDKVVSMCGGCDLGMKGNPKYKLTVAGYEMDFCSDHCLDKFKDDPSKAVLAMSVPAK